MSGSMELRRRKAPGEPHHTVPSKIMMMTSRLGRLHYMLLLACIFDFHSLANIFDFSDQSSHYFSTQESSNSSVRASPGSIPTMRRFRPVIARVMADLHSELPRDRARGEEGEQDHVQSGQHAKPARGGRRRESTLSSVSVDTHIRVHWTNLL